jgi:elongation factor G
MGERLGAKAVPVQIPLGAEDKFMGPVDLLEMKAIFYKDETLGADFEVRDIPAEFAEDAKKYREKMVEFLADIDEGIMEKYLGGKEITADELRAALRRGTTNLQLTPVICGSAFKNKGQRSAAGRGHGPG